MDGTGTGSGPPLPRVAPGRLTVVEQLYYQRGDDPQKPTGLDCRFSAECWAGSRAFQDEVTATEAWQPLDLGRVKVCRQLHVENKIKRFERNPTEAERQAADGLVAEFCFSPLERDVPKADIWLRPGETLRIEPRGQLWFRCLFGLATLVITAIPA